MSTSTKNYGFDDEETEFAITAMDVTEFFYREPERRQALPSREQLGADVQLELSEEDGGRTITVRVRVTYVREDVPQKDRKELLKFSGRFCFVPEDPENTGLHTRRIMAGIAISATRGMLALKTAGTFLQHVYLPPLDVAELLPALAYVAEHGGKKAKKDKAKPKR